MEYNKYIDHTLLKANATKKEIIKLCNEAKTYNFKAVCINPSWIKLAKKELKGSKILICTVIGFPLGQMSTNSKIFEAKDAVAMGADEVDMVINVSYLKDKDFDLLKSEISQIKKSIGKITLKVIVETALLEKEELIKISEIVRDSGADFIKTSTGFSTRGASFEDVEIMNSIVKGIIGIKAAGGVSNITDMIKMINLGATRIGTSRGVLIIENKDASSGY